MKSVTNSIKNFGKTVLNSISGKKSLADVMFSFIANNDVITINRIEVGQSPKCQTVHKSMPQFKSVYDKIVKANEEFGGDLNNEGYKTVLESCYEEMDRVYVLEKMTQGNITFDPFKNTLTVKTESGIQNVPSFFIDRIKNCVTSADAKNQIIGILKFVDKVYENPSYRAVNELYKFLRAANIRFDEEGDVICYKKVRKDFKDCHTGKIDNSPGKVVEVPRNQVNEDSNVTCSYGLHVCSASYLSCFGGERTLVVKVHPRDFVAIPNDYNNAKARVSRYEVLREVDENPSSEDAKYIKL